MVDMQFGISILQFLTYLTTLVLVESVGGNFHSHEDVKLTESTEPLLNRIDVLTFTDEQGVDVLPVLNVVNAGRQLNDLSGATFSFSMKGRQLNDDNNLTIDDYSEIQCGSLQTMGKYHALGNNVEVHVHEATETKTQIETTTSTFMADDFSCAITLSPEEGGFGLRGIHLDSKLGARSFEVVPCPGSPESKKECFKIEDSSESNYLCGVVEKHEGRLRRKLSGAKAAIPFTLDKWDDCFNGVRDTHEVQIGIAVGSEFVKRVGGSRRVLPYIEAIVSETNVVFLQQLNIKLSVREIQIVDPSAAGSTDWDNPGCRMDIFDQLDGFFSSEKKDLALWKLIDDCYVEGAIGVASSNSLCSETAVGVTYFSERGGTWKIFSHEIGHIFGASHSFEEGIGKTGGLMDYGDGLYRNEVQFNTRYRRQEICTFLRERIDCPYIRKLTSEKISSLESCGNGKLDDGEECECPAGLRECSCCQDCTLRKHAVCSPLGNECCSDECTYRPTNQICSHSDGPGYCRNGFCAASECAQMKRGDYCGVQNENLPCRKRCMTQDHRSCSVPPSISLHGRNLRNIRDGAFCQSPTILLGQCFDGECLEVVTSGSTIENELQTSFPTISPTEFPTISPTPFPTIPPTQFPTISPTLFPTISPTSFPTGPTSEPPSQLKTTFSPTPSVSKNPSKSPTEVPTALAPTEFPTVATTKFPTMFPSEFPTITPVQFPTRDPNKFRTVVPTEFPSLAPSGFPTTTPSNFPTMAPTRFPTISHTEFPTTSFPTSFPTKLPLSQSPTATPTFFPTTSSPTQFPTTSSPTEFPTEVTITSIPTMFPTNFPSTVSPTGFPTVEIDATPTSTPPIEGPGRDVGDNNPTPYPTFYPTAFPEFNLFDTSLATVSEKCCNDLRLIYGEDSFVSQEAHEICFGDKWAGRTCGFENFFNASKVCTSIGARLCSSQEIASIPIDTAKCSSDNDGFWTSTRCSSGLNESEIIVYELNGSQDDNVCVGQEEALSVMCCADIC